MDAVYDLQPIQNVDTLIVKKMHLLAFIVQLINCTAQMNKKSDKLDRIVGGG